MPEAEIIVIIYTTLYRMGGHQFPIVAKTLANEKRENGFGGEIICEAAESKSDVLKVFGEAKAAGKRIGEFHFVGHSGMYGPMFGTVKFPEQFSPYEWEQMEIPFAEKASACFHLAVAIVEKPAHADGVKVPLRTMRIPRHLRPT